MTEPELRLQCFHIVRARYPDTPWKPADVLCIEAEDLFVYLTTGQIPPAQSDGNDRRGKHAH